MTTTSSGVDLARLRVFAHDLANFYERFRQKYNDDDNHVSIDNFGVIFAEERMEYLHYCGGTTLEQPFFPTITADLLALSSTYLYIPHAVAAPQTRLFGLLLCLFFYSTQPSQGPLTSAATPVEEGAEEETKTAVATSSSTTEEYGQAAAPLEAPTAVQLKLPCTTIPISVDLMQQLLLSMPTATSDAEVTPVSATPRLSLLEAEILLKLSKANAWKISPFVDNSCHLLAILEAHDATLSLVNARAAAPAPPASSQLPNSLRRRRAVPGGADSLFGDAEYTALMDSYKLDSTRLLAP